MDDMVFDPRVAKKWDDLPQTTKVPVNIDSFLLGLKIPFDVYTKDGSGFSRTLPKWTRFDQELKASLKSKGIIYLYVEGDPPRVKEFFNKEPLVKSVSNENYAAYSKDKELYHHVSRLVFRVGDRVNFSIFTVDNIRFVPVLNIAPNQSAPVTEAVQNATGNLAIKVSDMNLYREYLSGLTKGAKNAPDNKTALQAKVACIKENVKMNVRDFHSDPDNPRNINGVVDSANQILAVLKRKEAGLKDLITLSARDFHIYNHSSNVAVLSTAMAVAMGMEEKKIEKLAIGAITHDIGLRALPPSILYKKEALTPDEFSVFKKHVNEGASTLQGKGLSRDSLDAVQQHHERLSGSGYPLGLKGSAITPFGRIIAIADSYDELITPRVLRPVLTSFEVLTLIMNETAKGDFDREIVKVFVSIIKGQGGK
jgi:putative nucleotidyltransferase with HDIG domain